MLRKALMVLAVVGLIDSIYLTWIKLTAEGVCVIGEGCEVVNTSQYASVGGIPVALLGAGAYLALLGILFLETRSHFFEFNGPILVFGISLAGVLYSAYLTYLELYVIRAICEFCVLSATVLVLMLILSSSRLRATFQGA